MARTLLQMVVLVCLTLVLTRSLVQSTPTPIPADQIPSGLPAVNADYIFTFQPGPGPSSVDFALVPFDNLPLVGGTCPPIVGGSIGGDIDFSTVCFEGLPDSEGNYSITMPGNIAKIAHIKWAFVCSVDQLPCNGIDGRQFSINPTRAVRFEQEWFTTNDQDELELFPAQQIPFSLDPAYITAHCSFASNCWKRHVQYTLITTLYDEFDNKALPLVMLQPEFYDFSSMDAPGSGIYTTIVTDPTHPDYRDVFSLWVNYNTYFDKPCAMAPSDITTRLDMSGLMWRSFDPLGLYLPGFFQGDFDCYWNEADFEVVFNLMPRFHLTPPPLLDIVPLGVPLINTSAPGVPSAHQTETVVSATDDSNFSPSSPSTFNPSYFVGVPFQIWIWGTHLPFMSVAYASAPWTDDPNSPMYGVLYPDEFFTYAISLEGCDQGKESFITSSYSLVPSIRYSADGGVQKISVIDFTVLTEMTIVLDVFFAGAPSFQLRLPITPSVANAPSATHASTPTLIDAATVVSTAGNIQYQYTTSVDFFTFDAFTNPTLGSLSPGDIAIATTPTPQSGDASLCPIPTCPNDECCEQLVNQNETVCPQPQFKCSFSLTYTVVDTPVDCQYNLPFTKSRNTIFDVTSSGKQSLLPLLVKLPTSPTPIYQYRCLIGPHAQFVDPTVNQSPDIAVGCYSRDIPNHFCSSTTTRTCGFKLISVFCYDVTSGDRVDLALCTQQLADKPYNTNPALHSLTLNNPVSVLLPSCSSDTAPQLHDVKCGYTPPVDGNDGDTGGGEDNDGDTDNPSAPNSSFSLRAPISVLIFILVFLHF